MLTLTGCQWQAGQNARCSADIPSRASQQPKSAYLVTLLPQWGSWDTHGVTSVSKSTQLDSSRVRNWTHKPSPWLDFNRFLWVLFFTRPWLWPSSCPAQTLPSQFSSLLISDQALHLLWWVLNLQQEHVTSHFNKNSLPCLSLLLFLIGVWTQGFPLAKQVLQPPASSS
jgi:hypothetical protein